MAFAQTSDVMTVGQVICAPTGSCRAPVYFKDNANTPVGNDQSAAKKVTKLALKVTYSQSTGCAATVDPFFDRTVGILNGITLDTETKPAAQGTSQTYTAGLSIATGGPLPFSTSTASPGDKVGEIVFSLSNCASFQLFLEAASTSVSSDDNTTETQANGGLTIVNGAVLIQGPVATFTATPTATSTTTPTRTPTPTSTVTPTPTGTLVPRTATPTPTVTSTPVPAAGVPFAIPTLDSRALALLAAILGAAGVILVKRPIG